MKWNKLAYNAHARNNNIETGEWMLGPFNGFTNTSTPSQGCSRHYNYYNALFRLPLNPPPPVIYKAVIRVEMEMCRVIRFIVCSCTQFSRGIICWRFSHICGFPGKCISRASLKNLLY